MQSFAGGPFDFDDRPANPHGTRRDGKVSGQAIHEAFDDGLVITAETGVVRAAHPGVAKEGRSPWKDALVGRLDMRMGADDCGDFSVEEPAHGDFLTGGFGVHIDDYDEGFLAQPFDLGHSGVERIVQNGLHKRAPLNIDDPHLALSGFEHKAPLPRGTDGVVDRPKQARLGGNVGRRVPLIPNMIAGRDDGHATPEEIDGNFSCDPAAARSVLAIYDDKIDAALLEEDGDESYHGVASRLTDNIAQEENTDHLSFVSKFPGCTV
jgi:hypothetical protein